MKDAWLIVACLLGMALALCVSASFGEDLPNVRWLSCYDGDTCEFEILLPKIFSPIPIRLTGIDTPEIRGKCDKEKLLALQARDFLIKIVSAASEVLLKSVTRDKYFRIDAGILWADGVNVNQWMIKKGYAVAYTGSGPRKDWCA